jgi:organic radical activating enzyme
MKGGKRQSVDEIAEAVHGFGNPHVVITGGEPTLYDLDPLLKVLNAMERNTQLETSGQQWLKGHITPNWITLSPKESLGWRFPFGYAKFASEVKWVVDGVLTFERVMTVWNWMRNDVGPNNLKGFVLMPEGCPPKPENIAITLDWLERVPYTAKMYWRYGDRIQYRIGVR